MYSHLSSLLNIIWYQTHICRQRGRSGKIPNLHKPRRFSGSRRSWAGQEVSVRLRPLSCLFLPLSFGLLKRYTGLFVHGPVITNRREFSSRIICIKKSITQHRSIRSLPMRFWYHGFATRGHHHNTTKHYHFPEVAWPELSQKWTSVLISLFVSNPQIYKFCFAAPYGGLLGLLPAFATLWRLQCIPRVLTQQPAIIPPPPLKTDRRVKYQLRPITSTRGCYFFRCWHSGLGDKMQQNAV